MAAATTTATPIVGDARYKAVRRVKNRTNAAIDRRVAQWTRAIASAKDKNKIAVLQAKIEGASIAKAYLNEN